VSNAGGVARLSGFVIELSVEERAELERRVACYSLPHKVVVRAKMIPYAAEGQSNTEIARRLETASEVVVVGESGSSRSGCLGWTTGSARAARAVSPRSRSPR
jgi:hypothetical protein